MDRSLPSARLEFLKSSARALCTDSPTTAAYLVGVHNDLVFDKCKPLTASQEREFCPACGTPRIPGWTSTVATASSKGGANRRRSSKPQNAGEQRSTAAQAGVAYKCLRCHRSVVQTFRKSPRNAQSQHGELPTSSSISQMPTGADPATTRSQVSTSTQSEKKTSENASSKKRAKARKNQGLLATLAAEKQQSQPAKSSSLDILDFLQS